MIPALLLLPDLPTPAAGAETAVAIQPNMSEDEQWTPASASRERDHLITISREAALRNNARLIIWPEVPGPIYYYQDFAFREEAAHLARDTHAYFLFGTVGETPQGAPLNSAVLLRPDGDLEDRYDKINLVPFGEYVPRLFGFVNRITKEAATSLPARASLFFRWAATAWACSSVTNRRFRPRCASSRNAARICWSISRTTAISARAPRASSTLAMARMRAVENRRWLLRATNDGITRCDRSRRPRHRPLADVSGSSRTDEFRLHQRHDVLHRIRRLVRVGMPACKAASLYSARKSPTTRRAKRPAGAMIPKS